MNQELEIEFKNMLTEAEYQMIFTNEFSNIPQTKHMTIQTNYYFDTLNKVLKEQDSALRVRVTDSYQELTLKSPSQGFLLETNLPLSDNELSEIINSKKIILSSFFPIKSTFPTLSNITENTIFYLFNAFETKRFEKQVGEHLIVLDQTTFQNGTIDYELEVESTDDVIGRNFFESFLQKYSIPVRLAKPKIARAEKNEQPFA